MSHLNRFRESGLGDFSRLSRCLIWRMSQLDGACLCHLGQMNLC